MQGKVASISKYDNTNIAFTYDAQGNRTTKKVTLPGGLITTTYYVRDAQGNVMSVYKGTRESASWGGTGHDHVITLSEQPIYGSSRIGLRLGNGLEVKRINFPLTGDPQVVSNGDYTYTDLGQLMSATISNEGAFITGAKALPGISASLKALTEDSYSISLTTDNPNTNGILEYNLLQDNTNSVWEGEAATTGSWSHTLTAGAETSDYELSIRQKSSIFDQPIARHINGKQYEITDHLGNVRAVVSAGLEYNPVGKRVNPRVIATNTYYPFGMLISSLSGNSEGYRYGFNQGSEKVDEITGGTGSHYTTYFRELDTRVVMWWTPDPKTKLTPWESPYSSMGGNPISNNDPKGDLSDWWQNNTGKAEKIDDKKLWDKGEMAKKGYSYLGEYQTDLFGTLDKPVYFNTVEIFNRDQDLWIVGYNLGGKHGRLEGEQGLIKVSKATNNLGTGMLLTPLAPVGEVFIIGSGLIDTGLDFKNISGTEATQNLFIRGATFGIGKGIGGQAEKFLKNTFGKRVIDVGVSKGLNEIQKKAIEKKD